MADTKRAQAPAYPTRWMAGEVHGSGGQWIVYRLTSRTTNEHLTKTRFANEAAALAAIAKAAGSAK